MALAGWLLDKSAVARGNDPIIRAQLRDLSGQLHVCPVGQLEQLYSARSAEEYDRLKTRLADSFRLVVAPSDVFDQALSMQQDLAHHHGMWHRVSIPDLLLAATAIHHGLGVVHVDSDFERIAEVRPLVVRRLDGS